MLQTKQRHQISFRFLFATLQLHIPNIVVATCINTSHQTLHGRWGGVPFHGRDLCGRAVRGGASGLGRIFNTVHHCINRCHCRCSSVCLRRLCWFCWNHCRNCSDNWLPLDLLLLCCSGDDIWKPRIVIVIDFCGSLVIALVLAFGDRLCDANTSSDQLHDKVQLTKLLDNFCACICTGAQ